MKRQANASPSRITLSATAIILAIALLTLLWVLQVRTQTPPAIGSYSQPDAMQQATTVIDGAYAGIVELDWALVGVYSDTLPTPTPLPPGTPSPTLSDIDLGLLFHQVGGQGNGHVDLSNTLMFTTEHTIMVTPVGPTPGPGTPTPESIELEVGPAVAVSYDGSVLRIESERFAMTTDAGQSLLRQFQLVGTADTDNLQRFRGDYRETIWGFGTQPLTLTGRFTLIKPGGSSLVVPTPAGDERVFLPLLQRRR